MTCRQPSGQESEVRFEAKAEYNEGRKLAADRIDAEKAGEGDAERGVGAGEDGEEPSSGAGGDGGGNPAPVLVGIGLLAAGAVAVPLLIRRSRAS